VVVKVVSGTGVLVRKRVASEQCQGAVDVRDEELKNGVEVQKGVGFLRTLAVVV
jgi:hypothetical protein